MLKNKKATNFTKILCVLFLVVLVGLVFKNFSFYKTTAENYDVDLVYLWCDGEEPAFRERKNYWLKQENKEPATQATAAGRFEQVDELKYSLRSVDKYLPWIRHIYIVTDRQVPPWLNTKNPKLTVVDHSEIIPSEYIPVFNSNAIETSIYKIPGLSEHFLYSNDDMFINRPLTKSFFFWHGKPIVRVKYAPINETSLYQVQLLNAIKLGEHYFAAEIPSFSQRTWAPHHNIDAYLKSDYAACAHQFDKEYQKTLTHRFRQADSVQRLLVSIWSIMHDHAQIKIVSKATKARQATDSLYIQNTEKNYVRKLIHRNPGLFCVNDSEFSTPEDRIRLKNFLEMYFPQKSEFEY